MVSLWPWQRRVLIGIALLLPAGAFLAPQALVGVSLAVLAVPFLLVSLVRLAALGGIGSRRGVRRAGERARSGSRQLELPTCSVLVPLYREAAVIPGLLAALAAIDYPEDRLEILLLVEEKDARTRGAIARQRLASHMRIVVVPDGEPRTKPRALQYALGLASGALVVVFDAEDEPEPDQIRRAVARFVTAGPDTVCVQACLNVDNWRECWLTRQFAIEYSALFDAILPALERLGMPVPLGGTSNYFRRRALIEAGGWDPYNVTEDADRGIRLARARSVVRVIGSTTWEEAPDTLRVWLGQRTRWLKGWMQTYLVHSRQPLRLLRELGLKGFLGFHIVMGGLILSALIHPWFYVLLAGEVLSGGALWPPPDGPSLVLWSIGLANLTLGYGAAMLLGIVCVLRRGRYRLALSALGMPIYWLLISLAAHRAVLELIRRPHHWQKTRHRSRVLAARRARI